MVGSICVQVFLWTITQVQQLCLYRRSLKPEDPDNLIYHLFLNWSDLELTELSLQFLASCLWDMWPHSINAVHFCCKIFPVCAKHTSFLMSPGVVCLSVPASASSIQSLIVKHDTLHKEEPGKPCPAAPRDMLPTFQMMLIFPITFQSNIIHCVISVIKYRHSQMSVSHSTKSTFAQSLHWFGQIFYSTVTFRKQKLLCLPGCC